MLNTMAVDGVRVPAAHLHELEVVVTRQRRDLGNQRPRCGRVPVLVDEAHRSSGGLAELVQLVGKPEHADNDVGPPGHHVLGH